MTQTSSSANSFQLIEILTCPINTAINNGSDAQVALTLFMDLFADKHYSLRAVPMRRKFTIKRSPDWLG